MQFQRIRAVVMGAGLVVAAPAALVGQSGCSSSGGVYTDAHQVVIADDGRPCRDQCLEVVSSTTAPWHGGPGRASLEDCSTEGRSAICEIEVVTYGEGRAPDGLQLSGVAAPGSLAHELARMAAVEASSVQPFLALADALETHGAPRRLVRGARAAAADEVRHARAASAWSRRMGGAPRVAWSAPAAAWADVEALARENRVQGVVGETWGAVLLAAQSEAAGTPGLRRFYGHVARDEARHSALAVAIDRWARTQLDARARRALDEAEAAALDEVEAVVRGPREARDPMSGAPEGERLAALWAGARAELWG